MTVENTTADLITRIDERLAALGLSDRQASLQATGVASSIRNIRRGSEPPASVLAKIAGVLQTSPSYLAFGQGESATIYENLNRQIVETNIELNHQATLAPEKAVEFLGRVAPGVWISGNVDAITRISSFPADPDYPLEHQFSVEVEGSLIDRTAPAGAVLGCVRLKEERIYPRTGDLVVIETRDALGRVERTARRLVEAVDHIELHGDTSDPQWQKPIIIRDGKNVDGEAVELIGLVTWVHMPVRRRAGMRRI